MASILFPDKYYLVVYGDLSYVGKAVAIRKDSVDMKFMQYKAGNQYDWPTRDQIETINIEQVICGPINIKGHLPFKIEGIQRAVKNYKLHQKDWKNI